RIRSVVTEFSSAFRRHCRCHIGKCVSGFSPRAELERLIRSAVLISSSGGAESFFEKAEDHSPCPGGGREEIEARQAATGQRLDQAQFHYQRLDSVAFHQTFRHARASALSKASARPDLYHLDRPRFLPD